MSRPLLVRISNDALLNFVVLAIAVALCGGCSRTYQLEGDIPSPVIEQLPLSAALHYPKSFREFTHTKESSDGMSYAFELGATQELLFDRLFRDLFKTVVNIPDIETAASLSPVVDLVIDLTVDDFAVATPLDNGSEFYEVSIRYGLSLLTPGGKSIAAWSVNGYGRNRPRNFVVFNSVSNSVSKATKEAIRDAATIVAVEVKNTPEVKLMLCEQESNPSNCKHKLAN